jgi:hypothetical protein
MRFSAFGSHRNGLRTESLSVFEQIRRCAEAPREPAWGSESLPPTIAPAMPRHRRCGVRPLMRASGYGPGARHATGKLMAPPLGFFVLSAFFSLGNRAAPVCLSGTLRSQGFSPSQRFSPARALRLCFASHPPIGFPVFRAFPTQSAVAPLDARCSFVVSSSSGSVGFPLPSLLPQPFIARHDRLQTSCALRIICAPLRASRHHLPCDGPKPIGRVRAVTPLVEVDAQGLAARFNVWSAAQRNNCRLARDANFRALLQLSVRSPSPAVRRVIEPMLS